MEWFFLSKGYEESKNRWNLMQEKMGETEIKEIIHALTSEEQENSNNYLKVYEKLGLTKNLKNAKSMLQELCQKQELEILEYTELERKGPDHMPIFRVEVSGFVFDNIYKSALGEEKSIKKAEMKAAEALCDEIFLEYIRSY